MQKVYFIVNILKIHDEEVFNEYFNGHIPSIEKFGGEFLVNGRGRCFMIGTMHLAKGLEFRAVVVMACDDEFSRCRSTSRPWQTTRTWKKSTTPSGTCSTSHAPVHGIICL